MLIILSMMIGALLTLTQYSGGMAGFVTWVTERGLVKTRRSAGVLAWAVSLAIFVESTIGVLIAGAQDQARAVADYIAGMTDRYAIKEHARVYNPEELT